MTSTITANGGSKGGGTAKSIQSACKASTGVLVSTSQIRRLRTESSVIAAEDALQKLQILPGFLSEIREKLPNALALLQTSELSEQLESAALRAFDMLGVEAEFDRFKERSIKSLYFGEADVVQHIENCIGHQIYTVDAAHMHRPAIGYDCIVMSITRRAGNGKLFSPCFCLTTEPESTETWSDFFKFCIRLGMKLQAEGALVISDMQKGLHAACHSLRINQRECLTHIFHRLQDAQHVFLSGSNKSIHAFFSFAKSTTEEERDFHLNILTRYHLKADKVDAFLTYWDQHADYASGLSAIDGDINPLGTFTSNNSESLHGAGSINKAHTPSRAQPWIDYVTKSISLTRSFFFRNRESISKETSACDNATISRYASEIIAQNANTGQRQFLLVFAHPELREKPFSLAPQKEEAARAAIINALWRCLFNSCPSTPPSPLILKPYNILSL